MAVTDLPKPNFFQNAKKPRFLLQGALIAAGAAGIALTLAGTALVLPFPTLGSILFVSGMSILFILQSAYLIHHVFTAKPKEPPSDTLPQGMRL